MADLSVGFARLKEQNSYKNIFDIMCSYGDDIAAAYLENGKEKTISYNEFKSLVAACAKKIKEKNIESAFIGIKMENSPLWPVVFWGGLAAGHDMLLIDVKSDAQATQHVLKQAGACAYITDTNVEVEDMQIIKTQEVANLNELLKEDFSNEFGSRIALCTSGTTSTSKVYAYDAKATCNQLLMAEKIYLSKNDIIMGSDIRNLAFLPLHHIFGFMAVYMWFSFCGKTIVYIPDRAPETILRTCRELHVTHLFAVPLFWNSVASTIVKKAKLKGNEAYEKLMKYVDKSISLQRRLGKLGRKTAAKLFFKDIQESLCGPDLRFAISGGGHILADTLKIINGLGYHLVNGFGMTETGINSVELSDDIERILSGSVGLPFEPTEYKIERKDNLSELLIKGPAIHSGRMVNGEMIPADLENGWFRSGDIASLKNSGYYIEGRSKEVIVNSSGENVYPDELEDWFIDIHGVENYCVTGVSEKGSPYELITLVVKMKEESGENAMKKAAEEICQKNTVLPIYKKLNKAFISKEVLPIASGIKVKRQEIRKRLEQDAIDVIEIDVNTGELKNAAATKKAKRIVKDIPDPLFREIKETVRGIFAEALTLDVAGIGDTDNFVEDLGGDSLSSLTVLTKAEEAYNIPINDSDYLSCTCVYDLAYLLYKRIKGIKDENETQEEKKDVKTISSFKDSREYQAFLIRRSEIEQCGLKDPFFVEHDSALKDVSIVDGREVINLASYNYLGFSGHPETMKAAQQAIEKYGTSASGSRLLAGEKPLHREFEKLIAKWKHTEDAVVCVGGHSTNVTFVGNFCNEHDLILYDALSHNSITQGCQLSKSDTKAFPHNDFAALENMLKLARPRYEKILIVVEGVYSMDGDIAPIPEFVKLKEKYGAFLMVDEAHSACVIGETGRGVDEYFGLNGNEIDIKMGTLSKGLGTCGGYLAAKKEITDWLRYSLPGFVFSVGLSPALAAASMKAIELMMQDNSRVKKLHENIKVFMREAKKHGFNTCLAGETAIVPILVGSDLDAYLLSEKLLERGVFVPSAVYPAVPKNQARLRFCLISDHKEEQIVYALNVLDELFEELNIKKP